MTVKENRDLMMVIVVVMMVMLVMVMVMMMMMMVMMVLMVMVMVVNPCVQPHPIPPHWTLCPELLPPGACSDTHRIPQPRLIPLKG